MTKFERRAMILSALAMACAPVTARATDYFVDDFDAGTSAVRYTAHAQDNDAGAETPGALQDLGAGPLPGAYDVKMDFNFNYGAFTHFYTDENNLPASRLIPKAPRTPGVTTVGLKVEVNNPSDAGGTGTAVLSLFPKLATYINTGGNVPSGDQKLTFDMWMNYNGPFNGGSGSTEFFTAGIQQAGTGIGGGIATGDPGLNGMALAFDGEGGNALFDYRFYSKNTRLGGALGLDQEAGYIAVDEGPGLPGPGGAFNGFYEAIFPNANPNNPNDIWYETTGAPGKHWTTFEIIHEDGVVYYYAKPDGAANKSLLAARTDEHTFSGDAMLGYADFNSGTAGLDAGADHSFAVFDNVLLESITQTRPKWNVNANGVWSNAGNWLNGVPNSNTATADFTDAISASGKTISVDSDKTIRAMVFDNAQPYTVNSTGGKIILDSLTTGILGTIKVKSGSHTVNANIDTTRIVWVDTAAGTSIALNGVITANENSRYLKKTGTGTLTLGGAGSTLNGGVRIEGGTLALGATNALPASAAGLLVTGSGSVFNTNGFNASTGQLTVNGNASVTGSGTLTVDNHLLSSGGGTISANLNFVPTTGFTGHRELITDTAPLTINGNIGGTPKLHEYGTGLNPNVVLGGTNTYTGATAVRGGNLVVTANAPSGAPGALGNSTSAVEVGDSSVTPLTAVRVASTANVTGTFNAGTGVLSGAVPTTLDGVTLADGDRILLKNQSDASTNGGRPANGVYVRTNATTWTRVAELNENSELQYGTQVAVTAGTVNTGRKYYLFDAGNLAINTAPQTWGQEITNAALLTGGAVTVGRDVNVLNGTATAASVYSVGGSTAHNSTFSGNVTLNRAVTLTAATGGTVNFTGNLVANGNDVTKGGAGKVVVKNVRTGNVSVAAGTLAMSPDATANGTSKVTTLAITAGAKLDLGRNKLISNNALGTEAAGVYSGVLGMIQQAYTGGSWTGNGLTSSDAAASGGLTSIGATTFSQKLGIGATDTAVFSGQTVTGAQTLAMYTYAGDANLDGFISGDDYSAIDFNIAIAGADSWTNGDFNYDGIISGDDYSVIDFNIVAQGTPFPTGGVAAGLTGVTAVPEPASLGVVALAAASLLCRRRRASLN